MKDFSYNDIKEASEEVFRMRENSRFHEDDYDKYKCNCRFEKKEDKTSAFQNGNNFCLQKNQYDDDKLLILALILILSKNSDDKLLLFALLYLIM